VHRNPDPATNGWIPYFLDVQADILERYQTRVVIPLVAESTFGLRTARLNPMFVVEGRPMVLSTTDIAAIGRNELGAYVASLASRRDDIINATDFLLTGI